MQPTVPMRKTAPVRSSVVTWQPERFRALIKARGMTMREIAIRADTTTGTLANYMRPGLRPAPPVLARLAKVLGVATTDLAPLTDEPTLHEYRWHTGMTVAELAAEVGLSPDRTGVVLRGEDRITRPDRWAQAFGVTEEQVLAAWHRTRHAAIQGK